MKREWRIAAPCGRFVLLIGFGTSLLALLAHVAIGIGDRIAEQQAQQAALERVALRADVAKSFLARYLEGFNGYFEMLQAKARPPGGLFVDHPGIDGLLRGWAAQARFAVYQVSIIGPDGICIWSTTSESVGVDLHDRAHIRVPLDGDTGLFVSEPLQGRNSHRWSIFLSRRLVDPRGDLVGVAVLSVDPILLGARLAELAPDHSHDVVLWRADGTLLTRLRDTAATLDRRPVRPLLIGAEDSVRLRMPLSRISGEDRLIAGVRIFGTPLAVSVSSGVPSAMADYLRIRSWWPVAESAVMVALAGLAAVALLAESRRAARRQSLAARRALETVRALQTQQKRLLDGVPAAIYRVTWPEREKRPLITFYNEIYRAWFGVADPELEGEPADQSLPSALSPTVAFFVSHVPAVRRPDERAATATKR
ncbi:MAG: hypothetical protein ACJ8AI_30030 [Rhodopila sp.]